MLTQDQIVEKAHALDFEDVGFTGAEPFDSQKQILAERREAYAWALEAGLDLLAGTDPRTVMPAAKTVIVLMEVYFRQAFPPSMEPFFGRCYLDDDRVTKDGLAPRIRAFRAFLRDHGIQSKVPFHLPHRLAAARAGMGTFGKNCLFYSNAVARQSSWVLPIAVVVDAEFAPGTPTLAVDCPERMRGCAACAPGPWGASAARRPATPWPVFNPGPRARWPRRLPPPWPMAPSAGRRKYDNDFLRREINHRPDFRLRLRLRPDRSLCELRHGRRKQTEMGPLAAGRHPIFPSANVGVCLR